MRISCFQQLTLGLGLILSLVTSPLYAGEPQPTLPKVVLLIGSQHFNAEIARTPSQLEAGLMYRQKMADNDGMLFCLGNEAVADFWMANTLIPLTVAYMDRSGKILELHDMQPLDRTDIRSNSDKIYYALEANQGWFALNKIKPGEIVHPVGTTLDKIRAGTN